jgi:hypothetical protein
LIHAFKQLSSPSAQRVHDVSPQLDQYAAEDRSDSPEDRMSLDSFLTEKNKTQMIERSSTEMDEDVEFVSEKKLKMEREFAAGPSNGVVVCTSVVSSALRELSETVTKKNYNQMILESGLVDGKWSLSALDIVAIIKRDFRFKVIVEEKLKGYKGRPENRFVNSLKSFRASVEDKFANEQKRREKTWKPDVANLCLSKETYQLQPLINNQNVEGYCIEAVHAGGSADVVLTSAYPHKHPLSWSEKLLLPVFLPIEAKSTFSSHLHSTQRNHGIHGLTGHPECAAFISFYQYDIESYPRLFAVILAKKIEVLLRYITVSSTGNAKFSYTPIISKVTGMLTSLVWNANMEKVVKDENVVVRTINDFTADQLEKPEWVIRKFISWADPTSTLTIADFQSESVDVQKGNLGEELTSIAFHSVEGAISRQGESITYDRVDLWMVKGDAEVSISCKTVGTTNKGNLKSWMFPVTEKLDGKNHVPVSYERSCDVWSAAVHNDFIEPNISSLKAPDGTHWILFIFTKEQLQDRLGKIQGIYFKPDEYLEIAIYFDSSKKILNPESIDRLIVPLFQK